MASHLAKKHDIEASRLIDDVRYLSPKSFLESEICRGYLNLQLCRSQSMLKIKIHIGIPKSLNR